jgi:beta-galactosidase
MLGIIGNKFSIGKETYQPYAAELHYFRLDKRHWSICFERIRRAGFRIIATAVPWNVHQDESKHIDFAGFDDSRKDLIVFLELAREFGFKVILRPGPWVAGQLKNGGLPEYIFKDIKAFARDSENQEISLPDEFGVKGGYLPSYLHRNFQFHLKTFFKSFIETTKNYVHPRGPIFMVELDYESSFGRLLEPGSADYNQDVLAEFYPNFLESRYEEIKQLNSKYREKSADFKSVEPPRKFTELALNDYVKVLDWFRFRQYVLNQYLDILEDIFKSYTVEPLFFRSLYFRSGDLLPAHNLVPEDRQPFLGSNVFPQGTYFDLVNKARYLKAEFGFAMATSFVSGRPASDPVRERVLSPVRNNERRFYYAAGLGAGFKGLNHYMFVDRDHWYGSPLHDDGTVSGGYEVASNFNQAISSIGFEDMDSKPDVCVLGNRLYHWLCLTSSKKEFQYVNRLVEESATGFCRDLMRLKIHYAIRENREWDSFDKYKVMFVPTTEIMAERDQEMLVEMAKAGTSLILCGVMPRYDENMKDCQVLANHFRIKTTVDNRIGTVDYKGGTFTSHIYASIRATDDSKTKKLCTSDNRKVIGVCSTRARGNLYLFTFDLASGGNHRKLTFVESILEGQGISQSLYCNDPCPVRRGTSAGRAVRRSGILEKRDNCTG